MTVPKEERRRVKKLAVDFLRNKRWLEGRCRLCPNPRKPTSCYCADCTAIEGAMSTERRRRRRALAAEGST